jgi:hypothetical protein
MKREEERSMKGSEERTMKDSEGADDDRFVKKDRNSTTTKLTGMNAYIYDISHICIY